MSPRLNSHAPLLSRIALAVDAQNRSELAADTITSEQDYVSTLVARMRDEVRKVGLTSHAMARILNPGEEQAFGCDAIIVLVGDRNAKVCLFEAKWPRMSYSSYSWDYIQSSTSTSHFSDQIRRQARVRFDAAIWEMVLIEHSPRSQPAGFDPIASTCIWHKDAARFAQRRNRRTVWRSHDLAALVQSLGAGGRNIGDMVRDAAQCTAGRGLKIAEGKVIIDTPEIPTEVEIPVSGPELLERAHGFCKKYGLKAYLQISSGESAV